MSYKYSSRIESDYGLSGPLLFDLVHDGSDNNVFIVTDSNGKKYALRESKRLAKNLEFEIELLTVLAQSGFSSPRPLQTVLKTHSIVIGTTQLVLFTFIQGIQITKLEPEHLTSDVIERGARKLGELHSVTNMLRVDTVPSRTIFSECDRLLKLDAELLKPFKDYQTVLDQVHDFYEEAQARITKKTELYGVIHNDYRIQNLIYTADDCFVIDFDWSCYGPLLKDIGLALAEWSMYTRSSGPSREAIKIFIKSYNEKAPRPISYNADLIFWICFACLSDTCTFLVDVIEGKYSEKVIIDVDQCHMYRKFKYFYQEFK